MVENDAGCIEIVNEINAIRADLQKVSVLMLDRYLRTCVATPLLGDDRDERRQMIGRIMDVFEVIG